MCEEEKGRQEELKDCVGVGGVGKETVVVLMIVTIFVLVRL